MNRAKDWMGASSKVRVRLRREMIARYEALKPRPGLKNRPFGAVALLASTYGLTPSRFVNLVKQKQYLAKRRVTRQAKRQEARK